MIVVVIILSLLVVIFGYTTFNLLKKVEKLEDRVNLYDELFTQIREITLFSDKKLKEIDTRGTFSSDDEVGWFFKHIKTLQEMFNKFKA